MLTGPKSVDDRHAKEKNTPDLLCDKKLIIIGTTFHVLVSID